MRNSLLPKNSLAGILTLLAGLNDEQFSAIKQAVGGARSFEIGPGLVSRLGDETGLSVATISQLTSAFGFLYRHVQDLIERDQAAFEQQVEKFVSDLDLSTYLEPDELASLLSRLRGVLRYAENHERFLKVSRLEGGFLPRLVSASSFVDLRPSFDANRTMIECLVPLVQVNFRTDSQRDDEANLVLQLDLQGLEILRRLIEDVDAKVKVLKSSPEYSSNLFITDEGTK